MPRNLSSSYLLVFISSHHTSLANCHMALDDFEDYFEEYCKPNLISLLFPSIFALLLHHSHGHPPKLICKMNFTECHLILLP